MLSDENFVDCCCLINLDEIEGVPEGCKHGCKGMFLVNAQLHIEHIGRCLCVLGLLLNSLSCRL
jgi:hypothetical protein